MSRRFPLWLTLVPLVAAIAIYWLFWSSWARDFGDELGRVLPAKGVAVTGFPYRLEARVVAPDWRAGDAVQVTASADSALVNRGPWATELTVIRAEYPRFAAIVGPGFGASFSGKTASTSVRIIDGKLARVSSIIEAAKVSVGFLPTAITADTLELHLRVRVPAAASAASATPPPRGQLVVRGERARLDGGDALTIMANMTANGPVRLIDFDRWAEAGTIEISKLTLGDAHGTVASVAATLVPVGRKALRFAGTIETVCPATLVAAWSGVAAPKELRLRVPVRLAFDGVAGAVRLAGVPGDLAGRARRGQDPACPVVRGRR